VATIFIRDLVVNGRHGVHEHEKTTPQPFKLSVELEFDTSHAQQSDDIGDTLDYSAMRQTIISVVEGSSYDLLERLAQVVADKLFEDSRVQQLRISIEKPAVYDTGVPGVTIDFTR